MTIINMAGGKSSKPIVVEAVEDTPSTLPHTYVPREGVDYLSSVTVGKDPNLVPGNIKKDVSIFGTVGTLESGGVLDISQDPVMISNNRLPFMTTPVRTGQGEDFGSCARINWNGGGGASGYWLGLANYSGYMSVGQTYGYITLPARANGTTVTCGDYVTSSGWSIMDNLGEGTFDIYGYRGAIQSSSITDDPETITTWTSMSPAVPRDSSGLMDMIHFKAVVSRDSPTEPWSAEITVLEDLPETPCYTGSPSAYWAGESFFPVNIHKLE